MKQIKWRIWAIVILVLLSGVEGFPRPPAVFYGKVLGGEYASVNVEVLDSRGNVCGEGTFEGSSYRVECYNAVRKDELSFRVNGMEAENKEEFIEGSISEVNLRIFPLKEDKTEMPAEDNSEGKAMVVLFLILIVISIGGLIRNALK